VWGYSHTVGRAGSPTRIVHVNMTLTQSKVEVKVTGLYISKNCTCLRQSPPPFWRGAQNWWLIMGPSLQLVWAWFSNCLLRKLWREFKLRRMSILHRFQIAIFPYSWRLWSHGRHDGSPICIAHTDVTLTLSKVKVTELLKFRKLHSSTSTSSAILAWC